MRYAIISDIHSNLEAFKAVLSDIDSKNIDEILCLGDIVGYNADPNECVDIVRNLGIKAIMGNHDKCASGLQESSAFNPQARAAITWTQSNLTEPNRRFLQSLPASLIIDDSFLMVHGSVDSLDEYIFGIHDAIWNFNMLKKTSGTDSCFFGHTHVPVIYTALDGTVFSDKVHDFFVDRSASYIINPGAVGQPRDRDPRAAYIIFDVEREWISFHRVEYDVERAAEKVKDRGLPHLLAGRLMKGW